MTLQEDDFSLQIVKQALLKEAKKGFDRNIACSPLSIIVMLNMLAAGSKGQDLEEFLRFLGSKNIDEVNAKSIKLMTLASNKGSSGNGGPRLAIGNGAWVDQRYPLKPYFKEVLKSVYKVKAKAVDFKTKGDEVIAEVNSWVDQATRGLIKDLLSRRSLNKKKVIILANALYFKGHWLYPFDPANTNDRKFYLLNGESVQVSFMCEFSEERLYGSYEDFKLLKLPYKNDKDERRFSMYFFLPNERDGLQKLLNQFDSDPGFLNQHFKLKEVTIDNLMIPKFKFSYGFDVSDAMFDLGFLLPLLNDMEIVDMVDCKNLRLMNIFQRSYIEVNEEGTEAAAVTFEYNMGFSLYSPPPLNFIADHPFMFLIREDKSQIPFFVGAVLNPLLH